MSSADIHDDFQLTRQGRARTWTLIKDGGCGLETIEKSSGSRRPRGRGIWKPTAKASLSRQPDRPRTALYEASKSNMAEASKIRRFSRKNRRRTRARYLIGASYRHGKYHVSTGCRSLKPPGRSFPSYTILLFWAVNWLGILVIRDNEIA